MYFDLYYIFLLFPWKLIGICAEKMRYHEVENNEKWKKSWETFFRKILQITSSQSFFKTPDFVRCPLKRADITSFMETVYWTSVLLLWFNSPKDWAIKVCDLNQFFFFISQMMKISSQKICNKILKNIFFKKIFNFFF